MNSIRVLCFAIAVFAVCHVEASPLKRQEAAEYQNCKKICGLCDCVGFYCGDECICECHNKTDGNVNCIGEMQHNCEKSDVPFEVLIQGPAGSRFVRSLVMADANGFKEPVDPKHVSTVSIFQPNGHKKLVKRDIEADVAEALADSANADAATIDERTRSEVAPASDDKKDEPKVGLALPGVAPILGLKGLGLLNLKNQLGLGVAAKLLPLQAGLTALPGLIPAKIAALKAKVGLGLLPLAAPLAAPIVPIL